MSLSLIFLKPREFADESLLKFEYYVPKRVQDGRCRSVMKIKVKIKFRCSAHRNRNTSGRCFSGAPFTAWLCPSCFEIFVSVS
jgi:hypothetical protein